MQLSKVLKQIKENRFFVFFNKHIFMRLWALLMYIIKNPLKSIFYVVKLYLALMLLSIMLVLSFSANAALELNYDTKVKPEEDRLYRCHIKLLEDELMLYSAIGACKTKFINNYSNYDCDPIYTESGSEGNLTFTFASTFECKLSSGTKGSWTATQEYAKKCPPTNSPNHSTPWVDNDGQDWCLELKEAPDCPPTNEVNDLVPSGAAICYKVEDGQGNFAQCEYQPNANGMVSVPVSLNENQLVNCSTGDNELPTTPDPDQPDADGCYSPPYSSGAKFCPRDPNNECETITNQKGETFYSCNSNCGWYQNEFLCMKDDGGNSFPDQTNPCDDPDYKIANPNVCNNQIDKDGSGTVDNSDVVAGLNQLGAINNTMSNTLANLLHASKTGSSREAEANKLLSKMDEKGFAQNKTLSSINGKLGSIDTTLGTIRDTFGGGGNGTSPSLDIVIPEKIVFSKHDWDVRNFYTVTADFVEGVKTSSIYSSVDTYFNVSFSGSCPVYTTSVEVFGTITFDQWCGAEMNSIWPWIEAVILLVFSLLAVREFIQ